MILLRYTVEGIMKEYENGTNLRAKVFAGVNKLADNVACTMGPRGRTVIVQQPGRSPIITKDGVTVSRFVNFVDPFENAAAEIIKQAAEETNSSAGDGTTTATVLARALLVGAHKYLVAGTSPILIKRGIDTTVAQLARAIKEISVPIKSLDDIINIATISANGDDVIGRLIGEAVDAIGKDGSITIKEGASLDTTLDIIEGFRFDSGVVSSKFFTNERTNVLQFDKPYYLITDEVISTLDQIIPALKLVSRTKRPLVIIAEDITEEALAAVIMNVVRGSMKVAAIKAPAYGEERREILSDLAVTVGATLFSEDMPDDHSLETVKLKDLGTSASIESSKRKTVITNGAGTVESIQARVTVLDLEIADSDDLQECEKIQSRIARLASSVAIIYVGGNTEVEMIERKHRIEDALEAVRSAQAEGMVEGGGVTLIRLSQTLDNLDFDHPDQRVGLNTVREACEAPLRQILRNADISEDIVLKYIKENSSEDDLKIYNLANDKYEDAFEAGVIDSAKVLRCALENAASAAGALITSDFAIIETT